VRITRLLDFEFTLFAISEYLTISCATHLIPDPQVANKLGSKFESRIAMAFIPILKRKDAW